MKVNFCNIFLFLIIEISFLVFGLNNILLNDVCEDLTNTNLMNIGFTTLILQSVKLYYILHFL